MTAPKILMIVLIVAAFGLGILVRGLGQGGPGDDGHGHGTEPSEQEAAPTRWTCSMHPQIILPSNDQQCPICFMDLIPLEEIAQEGIDPGELLLGESALALADIQTAKVARRAAQRQVRLVGKVKEDETRTRTITARVGGRLDRMYVDATGQLVTRGMKLADIYSPQLYSAQAELQAAARASSQGDGAGALAGTGDATVQAAVKKLRLWGLEEDQIQGILDKGQIQEHLVVRAPVGGVVLAKKANQGDYVSTGQVIYSIADLAKVWVTLDANETDLAWLAVGQEVLFTARAFPGREFTGSILFINPVLDSRTRTVEVRLQVDNAEGILKPGMLVTAQVGVTLGADGQPRLPSSSDQDMADLPLVIPATAPLLTGDRAVVYVRRLQDGQSVFSGRQVRLGSRAGDEYIVVAGLEEGEEVVSRGSFKIDSALQIQAQPSMMSQDPVNTEFEAALAQALGVYFNLQKALAGDDDAAAMTAAKDLMAEVALLDAAAGMLASNGRVAWSGHAGLIRNAATQVHAADNIDQRRLAFEPLSDNLWAVASHFGRGAELEVRRFHCPMAMDGAGAYWMQGGSTVANPYYGAAMLRCGSQVGVLK